MCRQVSIDGIEVSLRGFVVLLDSSTSLLRDGDLLHVELRQRKRKRQDALPSPVPQAAATAAPDSRQQPEGNVVGGDTTPAHALNPVINGAEKLASRSARRKAAKRRRRRLGLPVLPIQSLPPAPPKGPQIEKKEASTPSTSTATETSSSSSSEDSSSTSESESSSSDESSDSSSDDSSLVFDEEEELKKAGLLPLCEFIGKYQRGPPLTEAQFAKLMPVQISTAPPAEEDVLAYKLLEIGEDWAPRISEIRLGKVASVESQDGVIILTLEPYPDPSTHPLASQRLTMGHADRAGEEGEEDEEAEEGPPSNYDESGVLTAELSSFADLRHLDIAGLRPAAPAPAAAVVSTEKEMPNKLEETLVVTETAPLGPINYSRLGPPRAPAAVMQGAGTLPSTGASASGDVWASLVGQLQRRRAELSTPEAAAAPASPAPAGPPSASKRTDDDNPLAGGDGNGTERKVKVRRRSGMQSAVGPMLRMLRSTDDLK